MVDANNKNNKAREIIQANKSDNDANMVATMTIVNRTVDCDEYILLLLQKNSVKKVISPLLKQNYFRKWLFLIL